MNVVPWGFYNVIMWTTKRYNRPLIYITENGVDAPGESAMEIEVALKDDFRFIPHHLFLSLHICSDNTPSMLVIGTVRVAFYNSYISEMRRAMTDQANIAGYFAWSLLDNFE